MMTMIGLMMVSNDDNDDDWFDDVMVSNNDDDVMVNNDGFPSVAHRWRAKLYEPGCSHGWWGKFLDEK